MRKKSKNSIKLPLIMNYRDKFDFYKEIRPKKCHYSTWYNYEQFRRGGFKFRKRNLKYSDFLNRTFLIVFRITKICLFKIEFRNSIRQSKDIIWWSWSNKIYKPIIEFIYVELKNGYNGIWTRGLFVANETWYPYTIYPYNYMINIFLIKYSKIIMDITFSSFLVLFLFLN